MKNILLLILSSFMTANIILIQKNFVLNDLDKYDYFCIKNLLFFVFVITYMTFIKTETFSNIKKLKWDKVKYIILEVSLSIINVLLWYYLLSSSEAHTLIASKNPLTIILITLLSVILYKKKVLTNEIIGIIMILMGLFILNKK